MLTIQVRLLAGRYVASQFNDRNSAEWPPHPARLYAAAVSAWADVDEPDPTERAALEWWESFGPPTVTCSAREDVHARTAVTHYVPVNDATVLSRDSSGPYARLQAAFDDRAAADAAQPAHRSKLLQRAEQAERKARISAAGFAAGGTIPDSGLQVLPEQRIRQARSYPTVTPSDEVIKYCWSEAADNELHVAALDRVLARIARLGHSSSPVDVAVIEVSPGPLTYEPAEFGELELRTTAAGHLVALEEAYTEHRGIEPRILPTRSTSYRRRRVRGREAQVSSFDDQRWLLFELSPRRPIVASLALTRALRGALMAHSDQPPPEIITGHRPGTAQAPTGPSERVHAAYLALPNVAGPHADGAISAIAVVLPRGASSEARESMVRAVARWGSGDTRLVLGRSGVVAVRLLDPLEAWSTARPSTWSRPAKHWSSATPVALDRHPGSLDPRNPERRDNAIRQAEETIATACLNIGLPCPQRITVRMDAPIRGTRHVRGFPHFAVGESALRRMLVHVDLTFADPVTGPVIVGAGRYFGYGLCRPLDDYFQG